MPKIAYLYLCLLGSAISISLPLAAQETGNARGLIGESPYEIVSGCSTLSKRTVSRLAAIQPSGLKPQIEY